MNSRVERSALVSPKQRFVNHLAILRQYAFRVVGQDELLEIWEDADRVARLEDYFEVGISFGCTHRELVKVVLKDQLATRP